MNPIPPFGKNIRHFRAQKGLSLEALAERASVSKAMLSQIEKGKVNPTIGLLWKIAEGLHVQLRDLIGVERGAGFFERKDRDNCTTLLSDDRLCEIQILSPPKMIETVELYLLHFKPGGALESAAHRPQTEEIVTALAGEIEVRSGERRETVRPFASVHYSADTPHALTNVGAGEAKAYLAVRYP